MTLMHIRLPVASPTDVLGKTERWARYNSTCIQCETSQDIRWTYRVRQINRLYFSDQKDSDRYTCAVEHTSWLINEELEGKGTAMNRFFP